MTKVRCDNNIVLKFMSRNMRESEHTLLFAVRRIGANKFLGDR